MVTLEIGLPGAVVVTLNTVAVPTVGVPAPVVDRAIVGALLTAMATESLVVPVTVAVTVAAAPVVNVVIATPVASVTACVAPSVPAVVENDTGTPARRLPSASLTEAVIVTVPPLDATIAGFALTSTEAAAAPPISTVIGVSVRALPENATIDAVPDCVPAWSVTTAWPLLVTASCGSSVPSVEVKVTNVPLLAGVPLGSMTVAMISALPLTGSTLRLDTTVMTEAVGASNGTLSHAATDTRAQRLEASVTARTPAHVWTRGTIT